MNHPSKTVRRIYRKRVKRSRCRIKGKNVRTISSSLCNKRKGCKSVKRKGKTYCRRKRNRARLARDLGERRR